MSDLQPGAQTWIDKIAEMFRISSGEIGRVRSFKLAELNDMPGAVNMAMIPCALHYVRDCRPLYGMGSPTILFWEGRSDFHLTKDVKPANLAMLLRFYPRILAAAMGDVTLGGTAARFIIPDSPGVMRTITFKNPDGSDSHMGIEVTWNVEQNVTGSYTISA